MSGSSHPRCLPDGVSGVVDTPTGQQEWLWKPDFEACSSFPTSVGSTENYSFIGNPALAVVLGHRRVQTQR